MVVPHVLMWPLVVFLLLVFRSPVLHVLTVGGEQIGRDLLDNHLENSPGVLAFLGSFFSSPTYERGRTSSSTKAGALTAA